MNHMTAALELADLIVSMTDPKLTRARKEQLEIQGRAKAKSYIRRLEENK